MSLKSHVLKKINLSSSYHLPEDFHIIWPKRLKAESTHTCRVRFVASGSGSEFILFHLRFLKPEEASSVISNRGLLVLEALLPLPNFEWKTEDGRGHMTAFLSTTMAASAAGPTFNCFH